MNLQTDTPLVHDSIFELFINHQSVLIIESLDNLSPYNEEYCEVIIIVPNSSIVDQLDDTILYKGNEFELRHFAIINESNNKWK